PRRAAARSCRTCAVSAPPASCTRQRRARVSRPRSVPTWWRCSTRWRCRARCWRATTGGAGPRAWWRRCGPSAAPDCERRLWYQYYFHSERGRAGLAADRRALCRLLWRTWSPSWVFDDATFERSALAFDNPDFVDVVIHSYRHRFALVAGDPAYAAIEQRLAAQPPIGVPTISIDGTDDGVRGPADAARDAHRFSGARSHRLAHGVGHNMPQESPQAFADAVLELVRDAA